MGTLSLFDGLRARARKAAQTLHAANERRAEREYGPPELNGAPRRDDQPAHGPPPPAGELGHEQVAESARHIAREMAPLSRHDDVAVPRSVRIAAAWSWRVLTIVVAIAVGLWIVSHIQLVVIPVVVALLLAALLQPVVGWLRRRRVPRSLAAAIVLIGGLLAVSGTLTAVVQAFIDGLPNLSRNVEAGIGQIQAWLQTGPLQLSDRQLNSLLDDATNWVSENRRALTTGALSTATTAGHIFAGLFLALFTTFFFMRDGRIIWNFLVGMLPAQARETVGHAGDDSWRTLVSYVRATVLVAFIDAVGIGLGAMFLKVPLWLPIAALVFLASFVPIVGATLSGAVAVLVALVATSPLRALILLGVVIGVQQLEGHVLQPLVLGRAIAMHPLAVIVAITTGLVVAGIVGALIAVPLVAVLNAAVRRIAARSRPGVVEPPPPEPRPAT